MQIDTPEALEISKAIRLPFQFSGRNVYEFKLGTRSINDFHVFFEDTKAANTFPIVLLGDNWTDSEKMQSFIGGLTKSSVGEPRTCIFIIKNSDGSGYRVSSFRKLQDGELPIVAAEPAHSTQEIYWESLTRKDIITSHQETRSAFKGLGL